MSLLEGCQMAGEESRRRSHESRCQKRPSIEAKET
jgi:hypothetical protein